MWNGKLLGFIYLLAEHYEAVEASWEFELRRDLVDLWRPGGGDSQLTLRKAVLLTMQMPPGAAIWRATGGPMAWDTRDHWSSTIFHALTIANWQRTEAGRKGKNPPKAPEPPAYTHITRAKQERLNLKAERFLAKQQQFKAIASQAEREAPRPAQE